MIQTNYKHQQLCEQLRREISSGAFAGRRFYTVKAMMERFQVSQATLTKALQPLYDEGLIYSVSGKGTFVSGNTGRSGGEKREVLPTVYCIAASEEMFDPARTSPDWCFTQLILKGVVAASRRRGIPVNIAPISTGIEAFRNLADREDTMFIFLNYESCEQLVEYVVRKGAAYSLYTNEPFGRKLNTVFCDVGKATEDATSVLAEQGHREIAFFGDYPDSARHRGYRRALRRYGLPCREEYGWFVYRGLPVPAREEALKHLPECPEVSAVVTATDYRAIGLLQALREQERNCAVISIDNMWKYYPSAPALTSIDMHLEQAGEALFEALMQKHEDGLDRQRTIPHTLEYGSEQNKQF
ncbi:GntR family transcriptional regulator [uncultured Victivallis sp.]|uniref:GntR family transcriptional regulator n=1 Tax=uncultured Victivallis sp. TaxID=354118 RepID=UPI0025F29BF7|nr:GntR family transcriptional regulator [uncultured Victivallis sp.]